jgi:tellurite resistance-related uncharacterized protein
MPPGLRRRHRLAPGAWGLLTVHGGQLRFVMDSDPPLEREVTAGGAPQAIPPEIDHEVQAAGTVRFSIDFYGVTRGEGPGGRGEPEEGGDPACWAGSVCPTCGVVLDGSPHRPPCAPTLGISP